MKLSETVSWLMGTLQRHLFPRLEECWERPLTAKEQQLVSILELVQIEKFVASSSPQRFGRKRHDRRALARAFVAKAVCNHPFTCSTREALRTSRGLRRICGYGRRCDIPSESVFSRAFAEFAEMKLGEKVHEALVESLPNRDWWGISAGTPRPLRAGRNPWPRCGPPSRRPGKKAAPGEGKCGNLSRKPGCSARSGKPRPRPWRSCRCTAMWGPKRTPRV
jgi:hypothetical protein